MVGVVHASMASDSALPRCAFVERGSAQQLARAWLVRAWDVDQPAAGENVNSKKEKGPGRRKVCVCVSLSLSAGKRE